MTQHRHLLALLAVTVGIGAGGFGATAAAQAAGEPVCAQCHKDQYQAIAQTKHAVKGDPRTPFGTGAECGACHGDTVEHLKDPFKAKPSSFAKTVDARDRIARCSTCHRGGNRIHWAGSQHDRSDIACNDCHKVHVPKDQVLVAATQAGVCFDCHKDKRAAMFSASTHPLRTGWMPCTSCHQPHGSVGPFNLVKTTINDTCYQCHADKRGPFLWEHPPAREECTNCHNPHGTNNAPLLVARRPYLCQQCHNNPFHPSSVYSGNNIPPFPAGGAAGDKMLGNSCTNCHVKIHGSNHPSGARFTR